MNRLPITLVLLGALVFAPATAAQSLNVTVLGQRGDYAINSDIWGYRAPDGTELAIMGTFEGTTFIDATNPAAPVEVGFIPGPQTIWRDIKTYGNYAYITNEGGEGLQIVDLSIPLSPTLVKADSTVFTTAHNIFVDEPNATLYVAGSNAWGMVIFDISDPVNPVLLTNYQNKYIHDLSVRDGVAYLAAVDRGLLITLDVSALPARTELGTVTTPSATPHNTWLSQDGNYCFVTDEITAGHLSIYDVQDPTNPTLLTEFTHPDDSLSIVHNVIVKGALAYVSWYRTGLQILDVSDIRFPQRIAYYDTYPGTGSGFDGVWGVYPFQPSGVIYASDIDNGFYAFDVDPDYGWTTGLASDANTGLGIPGVQATIVSENNTIHTVDGGYYRFSLPPGSYDITFSHFQYESDTQTVIIYDDLVTPLNVNLSPLPSGTLAGYIGELGQWSPITDCVVELDGVPLSATTDSEGRYLFPSIPSGNYVVTVDHFAYGPQTVPFTIIGGRETEVNLALVPAVYVDDLEAASGWTVGDVGDDATAGFWELADPDGTGFGKVQPEDDHTLDPGSLCFVTGAAGTPTQVHENDVDAGKTSVLSPIYDLTGVNQPVLRYYRWYVNDAGANPSEDVFESFVSNDGGANWVALESTTQSTPAWVAREFDLQSFLAPTSQMRVKFVASDYGLASIVEAAVDDLEIYGTVDAVGIPDDPVDTRAQLFAASPNPFRSATTLRYAVASRGPVKLEVYDVTGRRQAVLADGAHEPGDYEIAWDGRESRGQRLASGVYFLKLTHPGGTGIEKVVLSR